MKKYLTSAEAAELLKVSRMTINRWTKSGKIPAIKANLSGERTRYLYDSEALEVLQ